MRDHKTMYGIYLRTGMLAAILLTIALFILVPYAEPEPYRLKKEIITMVEEITAEMAKYEAPPPVERPKVAVAAVSADVGSEEIQETIVATDFREDFIRTTPGGPEIEVVPYYKVEVKPQPVYSPMPDYPDLARRAGIEGTTVVKMLVEIDGSIIDVQILSSSGNQMLDEAALVAARRSTFTPARQRDKFVRVWVSRPFKFRLQGQ